MNAIRETPTARPIGRDTAGAGSDNPSHTGEGSVHRRHVPGIDSETYRQKFSGDLGEKALKQAHDIRKFEIDLYWKRATYFWLLNAAAFTAYAAMADKTDLRLFMASFGLVLSFSWYLVNRGSKQWQQNWEYHVDMLEDNVTGPLYKTVIVEDNRTSRVRTVITGPGQFSVSKVNIIVSLFIVVLWSILVLRALPHDKKLFIAKMLSFDITQIWIYNILPVIVALTAIVLMCRLGGTADPNVPNRARAISRVTYLGNNNMRPHSDAAIGAEKVEGVAEP
jgi:hypothetical protein